jgi:8-oxo-dGTP pyrophosphatase MutT (NUDIX family)
VIRDHVIDRLAPTAERLHAPLDADGAVARRRDRLRGDFVLDPRSHVADDLMPAAVLVPLVDHSEDMTVLLIQRADNLNRHAGQISFPGGRCEDSDATVVAAALRETEEEVGLPADRIEIVGRLDDYVTGTGFVVAPVVGVVRPPYTAVPDPLEVADVFEVPLRFFLDPANHHRESRMFRGVERRFYAMPYKDRYIWGATAAMLVNLYEVLTEETPAPS